MRKFFLHIYLSRDEMISYMDSYLNKLSVEEQKTATFHVEKCIEIGDDTERAQLNIRYESLENDDEYEKRTFFRKIYNISPLNET